MINISPYSLILMALPLSKSVQRFTYKDYLGWPEDERWELINGVAYDMSPAPSRLHQEISIILSSKIYNYLEGKPCKVYYAPFDVRLPEGQEIEDEIQTVVQPDIAVICDESKLDDKGCKGAPDWIIEIVSPNTVKKDLKEKAELYEKHGVREYWVIHPDDKIVMIYSLGEDRKYSRPEVYSNDDVVESKILSGMKIDLNLIFKE